MTSQPETGGPSVGPAEPVLLDRSAAGVRWLTLNRPAAFNSFNRELKLAFLAALADVAADRSARVLVLSGSGRAFCAGQDLKEHRELLAADPALVAGTVRDFYNPAIAAITQLRIPVLAAVNGAAAGAGAALAFAADLRVAAASATFSTAFAGVALSGDSGTSYTLPRLVGAGRASALLLLGERIDAAEALRIGMVDQVVPDAEFATAVGALAQRLAAGPTRAFGWIKAALRHGLDHDLASTLDFEAEAQTDLFVRADHQEALVAFAEHRAPAFRGE